jgi:tryptophan 2,3-dioxygenase
MLSMMYERQLDMSRQLDMCATLLMQFADTVKGFVDLHATTLERVDRLRKDIGGGSGVDVMSVANDPEKSH